MVALIQSSAQMLERMMSDILDQAKVEAGNFQLQTAPFDLRREIEFAAELMRPRAEGKGLKFDVTYTDAAEGEFAGDAVRLKQIISNLVSNAIKFTASGGVTVKVKALDPATAGQPTLIRIEVADTGIGFDAETASRLFSRFVQADGSISRQFGGTGLGLAICKALAELMGGRISVCSEPGQGSVFRVEIPLPRSVPLAEYRQRSVGATAPRADLAVRALPLLTMRILLVEDHPINQQVVQYILKSKGVALTTVGNGRMAVEAWQAQCFDVILMDMQMPVMDGLTAVREIRRLEAAHAKPRLSIIMLTANAMPEHIADAMSAGADLHLGKPFTAQALFDAIAEAVAVCAADEELAA
jgi:two-component system, sensor histidine kinase